MPRQGITTFTHFESPFDVLILDILFHAVITLEFNHVLVNTLVFRFVGVTLVYIVVDEAADLPSYIIFGFGVDIIVKVQIL